MNEVSVAVTEDSIQYIVIRLGDEQYGIDIKYIDNILRVPGITRVPKVPSYITGVINLRGEVVPVMNLRLKMGLEDTEFTNSTRIIILRTEHQSMTGVIVDEVKEVVTLSSEQVDDVNHETNSEEVRFINGVGKYEGGLISLLNLNSVIGDSAA
ncbi:MAG: purine-binding chemotaxis protein CheW [Lachnospiraceae bacterium]|nr:purine-binding chemotaxis protein CheW [Lachnospiraceae bacterium]